MLSCLHARLPVTGSRNESSFSLTNPLQANTLSTVVSLDILKDGDFFGDIEVSNHCIPTLQRKKVWQISFLLKPDRLAFPSPLIVSPCGPTRVASIITFQKIRFHYLLLCLCLCCPTQHLSVTAIHVYIFLFFNLSSGDEAFLQFFQEKTAGKAYKVSRLRVCGLWTV